jgi:hypothetical protein
MNTDRVEASQIIEGSSPSLRISRVHTSARRQIG